MKFSFPKIPFYNIYKWLFKTFKINADTQLIEKLLEESSFKHAMVVKRSWIFALMNSWVLIATVILTIWNWYNISNFLGLDSFNWILLISLLAWSLGMLLFSSISFIYKYRKTYGQGNKIEDVNYILQELKDWDELFESFFNQITTNLFLFGFVIVFYVYQIINSFFIQEVNWSILIAVIDIVLLWCQIYLMRVYRKKMIDLELDFNVVVPWKLYFFNQSNMYSQSQTLQSSKIKTISDKTNNFFMSFFNLWSISVLTEWDQGWLWMMDIYYVEGPKETIANIYTLVNMKPKEIKNKYLLQIINHLWLTVDNFEKPENKQKIKEFLQKNDEWIQEDFKELNFIAKEEIRELYTLIY